jgi:8-amino-7-oxononanoate synthase
MTKMKKQNDYIQQQLKKREDENALRTLKVSTGLIDFCSNDYLGFSSEKEIHTLDEELAKYGATGSRLISGNYKLTEEVEDFLANFYQSESALIFNSGYNANMGFFSCVSQRGDTVFYDELIHASIRDGIRLGNANSFSFKHNNVEELANKIDKVEGNVFVVVESVYSMDGDFAPLKEIAAICKKGNVALIVDEAHSAGIFGNGKGLCVEFGLEKEVFARIVTFGKAYGCHGAAVIGNRELRSYLINFSRPFIYTTALPLQSVLAIKKAHEFLIDNLDRIENLKENISFFKSTYNNCYPELVEGSIINSQSPIQCIIVSGNKEVKSLAEKIQEEGFDVRPILSPTVPKGQERLRICLHSFNTKEEINNLITELIPS